MVCTDGVMVLCPHMPLGIGWCTIEWIPCIIILYIYYMSLWISSIYGCIYVHISCNIYIPTYTMFNSEIYQWFPSDTHGINTACSVTGLEIPVLLDNGCTFSIVTKQLCDMHKILHKCFRIPADNMIIHTRNGDIRLSFGLSSHLCIEEVDIQMPLLVCKTQAKVGTPFEKDAFDKIGCW